MLIFKGDKMENIFFRGKEINITTDLNAFFCKISRYLLNDKFVLRYKIKGDSDFINLEVVQIPCIMKDKTYVLSAEKAYPYIIKFELQIHEGGKRVTFSSEGDHFESLQDLYQVIKKFSNE